MCIWRCRRRDCFRNRFNSHPLCWHFRQQTIYMHISPHCDPAFEEHAYCKIVFRSVCSMVSSIEVPSGHIQQCIMNSGILHILYIYWNEDGFLSTTRATDSEEFESCATQYNISLLTYFRPVRSLSLSLLAIAKVRSITENPSLGPRIALAERGNYLVLAKITVSAKRTCAAHVQWPPTIRFCRLQLKKQFGRIFKNVIYGYVAVAKSTNRCLPNSSRGMDKKKQNTWKRKMSLYRYRMVQSLFNIAQHQPSAVEWRQATGVMPGLKIKPSIATAQRVLWRICNTRWSLQ